MAPEIISRDHSIDQIIESNHFDTLIIPKRALGFGEKTFAHFGAIFLNKFIASSKSRKSYDFKQYLFKNLGIMHDLFLKTFSKYNNSFIYNFKRK